ncbi:hypothetical protein JRO89_XSUnG0102300 [Xanthoceras sorbifolium]|uniref:ABC transporter B family member 26, chloroplastic n=1 Tax=Xanthoceras sorbifolium TaxID=99658 RepID=A0ABQ8GZG7_9ROSI|nr:hypothetical protein JRO89_XSUnG0102300 [Xanthoceras sorbifolium]
MALLLCSVQPRVFSSLHRQHRPRINHRYLGFPTEKGLRFFPANISPKFKQRYRLSRLNSSSINGFSVQKNNSLEHIAGEEGDVEFNERIRRWIHFVQSVFPGGSWWSFSDDVEVKMTAKPVTVWRALCKMWELVSKDRWVIFAAFSALIVAALSEISIPHFLTASIFTAQSGEIAVFHGNVRLLILLCVTSGICRLKSCMRSTRLLFWHCKYDSCEANEGNIIFRYSSPGSDISFFDSETVGDLTSRLGSDCQQVSRVIGNDLNLILRNVLQGTGALIYLLVLSWPLGLCTLVICSTLAGVMLVYGLYQKKAAKLTQEFTASANEVAQETFSLMRTVRVYGTEKAELERYNQWLGKLADISLRQSAAYGFWNLSFNMLYHSTQVIAVLIGGMSILTGNITAEKLTKFILYSEWLIYSTWWVGDNLSSLMQSVGASEKVFQLMDLMPSNQFISKGKHFMIFNGSCKYVDLRKIILVVHVLVGKKLQRLMGRIDFVNVSFHYSSRPTAPVLQNVSIAVTPGEVVAIVGLSGSGKSTLVNLLLRLYEPTNGQILIDGFPLKELDIKWVRERIGFVGQEPKLFRMDISSNIKYGCTRDIKQEDIEWAAKQAYAHDFISSLPNGYGTLVDDDLLSGGQKQRIAIARAILRDPNILILDEATSALDAESEHNVKGVLRALRSDTMTKRTVLVIAHRLSTIQAADRIVVMGGGRVIEMGSHRDLVREEGLYARLNRRQADAVAGS